MRLVAGYKGPIVWGSFLIFPGNINRLLTIPRLGLNRGANNISNTIAAASAAAKEIPSLYALELGNEPVSRTHLSAFHLLQIRSSANYN
jgi:hypothetical protein